MCAINPKRQHHFMLSVYTSAELDSEEFDKLVYEKIIKTEMELNADMRLRWHIKEGIEWP